MYAVGAGRQRDVGAIVDQERRSESRADLPQGAGVGEQRAGWLSGMAKLDARGAARQDGQRRFHRRRGIARRRRDQVQPDHAAPITPASGLEALP